MAVIQKPDALSLSGNLKKFEVHSGGTVLFMLKEGETVIYEGSYEPGVNGVVYIDVKDIIDSRLSFILSHSIFYQQTSICKSFTAKIDGIDYAFTVLRGGIANLADSVANWLTGNFLTWQPTSKPVTYYSPEWITYYALQASNIKLKAYLPGDTEQIITLGSCEAGKAFTCNVQYAGVAGLLAQQYPTHYDVWVEDLSGTRLSYIQRYLYSDPKSELEQWFLYENSLGGIDTIRAYGDTDFESVHTHGISEIDEVASEYRVDTERFYNKNTGYLDEYERRWLLDFFPSRSKYVHYNGAIRKIVVTEDDAKYAVSDLPSSYTFRYRFSDDTAGLLNLIRNEDQIPEVITIPNLESPDFSLPPRLSEYPRVPLHEGVIIPAFDPHSPDPKVTSVGALIAAAVFEVFQRIEAGEGGGELVNILRSTSSEEASDYSVFSSLRTIREIEKYSDEHISDKYISKLVDDIANGLIKFMKGIEVGEFIPGMFGGKGANIDNLGNIEATSLRLRALLEVPELRYNRLTVIGDEFILTENALIESVQHMVDRSYQLNIKLEEGEAIAYDAGTLIKGIFNNAATSGMVATSYMRIEEVGPTFIKITLANDADVPTGYNLPPQPFMNVARVGHVADPNRQRYMVFSSRLGGYQLYDGASDFMNGTLVASFDVAQSFKSKYNELPLKEGLPYVYAAGLVVEDIIRVDYQGVSHREIYDRGPWQSGVTYYNNDVNGTDDVWHLGCRWRCFSSSTTEEPSWTSAAWYMIEGRSDTRMEFDSSNGFSFFAGNVDTVITPVVIIGNTNVSASIVEEQWSWARDSGDQTADAIWNIQKGVGRILHITNNDMGTSWSRTNPVRFICTATYPASSINNISSYIEV